MFCILHYYICKTTRYRACRRWHKPRTSCALSEIGLERIYFHTEPKSNIKVPRSLGINYKCSKLSANISINTCYMFMLYLLVIHTSKEFDTYHEAEILSVLPQLITYPLIRRGKSEGNCKIQQKSPVAFYGDWLHLQLFHQKVSSSCVHSCILPCEGTSRKAKWC